MQNGELLSLKSLSASIGTDPMLVQGAGGNTSIKIGSQIWVKASGTWLQNALTEEIFIPIDLRKFHRKLNPNIFVSSNKSCPLNVGLYPIFAIPFFINFEFVAITA